MTAIDDVTLMAYADGELEPAERQRIEAALARDADLRERLALFAGTSTLLAPLDESLSEPLSPALERRIEALAAALSEHERSAGAGMSDQQFPAADLLDQAAAAAPLPRQPAPDPTAGEIQRERDAARPVSSAPDRSASAAPDRSSRGDRGRHNAEGGLLHAIRDWLFGSPRGFAAAAATFVLGGLAGMLAPAIWQPGPSAPPADPAAMASAGGDAFLARALASAPAGTELSQDGAAGRRSLTPLMSIRTTAGEYCREYLDVHSGSPAAPAGRSARGLACRDDGGNWQLRVLVAQGDAGAAGGQPSDSYQPASGGLAEFDALVEQLAPGEPLSDAQEAAAIARGWRNE